MPGRRIDPERTRGRSRARARPPRPPRPAGEPRAGTSAHGRSGRASRAIRASSGVVTRAHLGRALKRTSRTSDDEVGTPDHVRPCAHDPTPRPSLVLAATDEPRVVRARRAVPPAGGVFHDVLSEQSLDALLDRIADTLAELSRTRTLHIYEADEAKRELIPVLARSKWADEILSERFPFGEGITGWAVEHREPVLANQAHLDPRVRFVPGHAGRARGADRGPAYRARGRSRARSTSTGSARTRASPRRSSSSPHVSATRPRSPSTTRTSARASSTRRQTDSLTGPLQPPLRSTTGSGTSSPRASAEHDSVALVMIDLDDFKKVNDVYGHGVGDQLLIAARRAPARPVRASDVVCRIGGEEFAIIVPSGDVASSRARLAERLGSGSRSSSSSRPGASPSRPASRMGPEHAANPRELVACAEAAMMTAKSRGKGRWSSSTSRRRERPPHGPREATTSARSPT